MDNISAPVKLIDELKSIVVDMTEAYYDLGETDFGAFESAVRSLYDDCVKILPFIRPLLELEVEPQEIREVALGEFDSHKFKFVSAIKGRAARNQGLPAFVLQIVVDGYAPVVFSLTISEVYYFLQH